MRTPWLPVLLVILALASGGCERNMPGTAQRPTPDADYLLLWESYRQAFIRDGRVIDVDNGGITHSEAQGYGMLLAEAAGDRPTFDRLLD
jgi:endoglucanase